MERIADSLGIAPVAVPGLVTGSQLAKEHPHAVVGFERRPVFYTALLVVLLIVVIPFGYAVIVEIMRAAD
jgi:hypothetical protein